MSILVTGVQGFIGKNLLVRLREQGFDDIIECDRSHTFEQLKPKLSEVDFVFHLAGVNRPKKESEFFSGNLDLTQKLLDELMRIGRYIPVVLSSSIQAQFSNPYGESKALAEEAVLKYQEKCGAPVYIYRLPNVFGKWCKPNYNSVIATFCHNIVNDFPITIHDESSKLHLVYIDDVCNAFIGLLKKKQASGFVNISPLFDTTVGEVANLLRSFKVSRESLLINDVGIGFTRALYSTYLSYFNPEQFVYSIPSYADERGSFSEMLKTSKSGQFSFFTANIGITRGGHYHHSKNEKFLVIKGSARFKFEQIITGERYSLDVDSSNLQVVETVPGWSHDITNIGQEELIVMLWANEIFDRESPDTFTRPL
ncbi:UDP-2-acetamido-2,6-beta-L-arabino-hexul-4-ose reductase [Candidatus Njordibacter sp. Uisw_002]|uniref:UDP-2-acetamido-2,6-beta-L-arabino-hexul-4-ose reductase n=1 Tax=Candidatus Njordibacter sp. Uisw_002 TaxID=3230971 RepID=UPI003D414A0E